MIIKIYRFCFFLKDLKIIFPHAFYTGWSHQGEGYEGFDDVHIYEWHQSHHCSRQQGAWQKLSKCQYTHLIMSILQSKEGYLDRINKLFVSFQSYSSVRLNLDCSGSRNCLTNQPSMDETFSVKSQSQIVSFFLTHLL